MPQFELDDKDLIILQHLKSDARLSVRKLAKLTKIRPSTVHNRIQRLVKEGVVEKFTIKLNPENMGERLTVFMLVSGALDKYIDERFVKNPHIIEVHGITGEYDMLLKLRFKDMKQFNKFIIEFREKYSKSISKTITMVQTASLKE
jgi:DNA-binding Lrp family transcriptional regulator